MKLVENRWQQLDGELAARLAVKDVRGWLCKKLIVEAGQRVLLSADGHPYPIQGPGSYTLRDVGDKLAQMIGARAVQRMNAILFSDGAFSLTFTPDEFFTQDPYRVGLEIIVTLQISDPETVNTTLLRGQETVTEKDARNYLLPDVTNAAQEWIGSHTLDELIVTFETKDDFEVHLTDRLRRACRNVGLAFEQLRTLNYRLIHRDRLNEINESYLVKQTALAAELTGETKLFDLLTEKELLAIREETREVEMFERRVVVRDRMRRAVQSDRFAELSDERETEQFLRSIDAERLLADDEWERIQRAIQWRKDDALRQRDQLLDRQLWRQETGKDDRVRDRVYLLARLEIERQFALKSAELTQRKAYEPAQREHEIHLARLDLEAQHAEIAARQAFEITQTEQRNAFEVRQEQQRRNLERQQVELDAIQRRDAELKDAVVRRKNDLADAHADAEKAHLRIEIERAEAEMGMLNLERMKAIRRRDDEERQLRTLEAEERRLEMQLRRDQQIFERELIRLQTEQRHELDWMDKLRGMTPHELVVAARETDRARLIHDMQETTAMQGMTEEQILAKMSGNSPEAARALAEIRVAAVEGRMGEERQEMYERLLQQQEQVTAVWRDQSERMERMRRDDALDRQAERDSTRGLIESQLRGMADIEQAKSNQRRPSHPPPNIIVTGSGTTAPDPGYYPSSGYGDDLYEEMRCPHCGEGNRPNAKFCGDCGKPLR